jgi:hypothetical protein
MRLIRSFVGLVVLSLGFSACFEAPHFSDIPEIEFVNVSFKDVTNPATADTLIITISFKDGDGDLGLGEDVSDELYPYNDKFFYELNGQEVYFPPDTIPYNDGTLINYKAKRTGGYPYDTLPDFLTPYSCTRWTVTTDFASGKTTDTLYSNINPYHYNFFVDFFVQQADGSFKLFDWNEQYTYPNCVPAGFDGRFPVLSQDLTQKTPQEGNIVYKMQSVGFNYVFSIKTLQLRIRILDRALHSSNTIFTPSFSLH